MTLANESSKIEKAVSSVYQLTEDDLIYLQMREREDNERYWNYMHNKVKRLEEENENDKEIIAEKDEIIERLKKELKKYKHTS